MSLRKGMFAALVVGVLAIGQVASAQVVVPTGGSATVNGGTGGTAGTGRTPGTGRTAGTGRTPGTGRTEGTGRTPGTGRTAGTGRTPGTGRTGGTARPGSLPNTGMNASAIAFDGLTLLGFGAIALTARRRYAHA